MKVGLPNKNKAEYPFHTHIHTHTHIDTQITANVCVCVCVWVYGGWGCNHKYWSKSIHAYFQRLGRIIRSYQGWLSTRQLLVSAATTWTMSENDLTFFSLKEYWSHRQPMHWAYSLHIFSNSQVNIIMFKYIDRPSLSIEYTSLSVIFSWPIGYIMKTSNTI